MKPSSSPSFLNKRSCVSCSIVLPRGGVGWWCSTLNSDLLLICSSVCNCNEMWRRFAIAYRGVLFGTATTRPKQPTPPPFSVPRNHCQWNGTRMEKKDSQWHSRRAVVQSSALSLLDMISLLLCVHVLVAVAVVWSRVVLGFLSQELCLSRNLRGFRIPHTQHSQKVLLRT